MGSQVDIQVNLIPKFDAATNAVKNLQNQLKGLKINPSLKANLDTAFTKSLTSLERLKDISLGDIKSPKGIKEYEQVLKEVESNLKNLEREAGKVNLKNIDVSALKQLNFSSQLKQIEQLQQKMAQLAKPINLAGIKTENSKGNTYQAVAAIQAYNEAVQAGADNDTIIQRWGEALKQAERAAKNGLMPQEIRELVTAVKEVDPTQIEKLGEDIEKLESEVNSGVANAFKQIGTAVDEIGASRGQVVSLGTSFKETARQSMELKKEVEMLGSRASYFFSLTNAVMLFRKALREAKETVKELDATMTEAAVVTQFSVSDMWSQLPDYTRRANKRGVTINEAYQASTLFYQQGLNQEQAETVSDQALKLAKIANIDASRATDTLTTSLRGFNMEVNAMNAEKINDVFSNLAARSASNVEELSTAMEKVASIASSAGMEFENTAAFLAQIIETTREAPETAGTALKTVVARFSEVKKLWSEGELTGTDEEGEEIVINRVDEALQTAGIHIKDFLNGTKGIDDIFLELASKWDTLSTAQQRYIATQAAGSRQQSRFLALMGNYDRLQELTGYAYDSAGASEKQFEKTTDSLEYKTNQLHNAWNNFLMGMANSDMIKGAISALTKLLNVINKLIDASSGGSGKLKSLISIFATASAFGALRKMVGGSGLSGFGLWGKATQSLSDGTTLTRAATRQEWKDARAARGVVPLKDRLTSFWGGETGVFSSTRSDFKQEQKAYFAQQQAYADKIRNTEYGGQAGLHDNLYKKAKKKTLSADHPASVQAQKQIMALGAACAAAGVGLKALGAHFEQEGKQGLGQAFKVLGTSATALGASLMLLSSMGAVVSTEAGTLALAFGSLTLPLLPLVAAFAALAAIVAVVAGAIHTYNERLDSLTESTNKAKESQQEAEQKQQLIQDDIDKAQEIADSYEVDVEINEDNLELSLGKIDAEANLSADDRKALEEISDSYDSKKLDAAIAKQKAKNDTAIAANDAVNLDKRGHTLQYGNDYVNGTNAEILDQLQQRRTEVENQIEITKSKINDNLAKGLDASGFEKQLENLEQKLTDIDSASMQTYNDMQMAKDALTASAEAGNQLSADQLQYLGELNQALYEFSHQDWTEADYINDLFSGNDGQYLLNRLNELTDSSLTFEQALEQIGYSSAYLESLGISVNNLKEHWLSLQDQVENTKEEMTTIPNGISVLDVENAFSSDNADKNWNTIAGGWEDVDKLYQRDRVGNDDFQNWVGFMVGKEWSGGAAYERADEYEKAYADAAKVSARYFDNRSEETADASVQRFMNDLIGEGGASLNGDFVDLSNFKNTQQIAKYLQDTQGLNISAAAVQALLEATNEFGWDTSGIKDSAAMFEEYKGGIESLQEMYDNMDDSNPFKAKLREQLEKYNGELENTEDLLENLSEEDLENLLEIQLTAKLSTDLVDVQQRGEYGGATRDDLGTIIAARDALKEQDILSAEAFEKVGDFIDTAIKTGSSTDITQAANLLSGLSQSRDQTFASFQEMGVSRDELSRLEAQASSYAKDNGMSQDEVLGMMSTFSAEQIQAILGGMSIDDILAEMNNEEDDYLAQTAENTAIIAENTAPDGNNGEGGEGTPKESTSPKKEKILDRDWTHGGADGFNPYGAPDTSPGKATSVNTPTTPTKEPKKDSSLTNLETTVSQVLSKLEEIASTAKGIESKIKENKPQPTTGAKQLFSSNTAKETVQNTKVKVNAKELVKVQTQKKALGSATNIPVNVTGNALTQIHNITNALRQLKTVVISLNASASGGGKLNGTSKLNGTAYASGKGATRKSETALTGELGPEMVVHGNKWWTVGDNGPEFTHIPANSVVFNHKQTADLLTKGYTTKRGKALANGTAFAPGDGGYKVKKNASLYPGGSASSSNSGKSGAKSSGGGGVSSKDAQGFLAKIDHLYNLVADIEENQKHQETLTKQYKNLLWDQNATAQDIYRNLLAQKSTLQEELGLQQKLYEGRAAELNSIGSRRWIDSDNNKHTFNDINAGQYAWWNWDKMQVEVDWQKIEGLDKNGANKDTYSAVQEYISQLEDWGKQITEIDGNIADLKETFHDIEKQIRDDYINLEERMLDAIVKQRQEAIDNAHNLAEATSEANDDILKSLKEQVDLERQIRDNTKTEEDITEKERRLAYLRRDTSGSNAVEIKKLEEELSDARDDYRDKLVDQMLERMTDDNDKASEQRNKQIEIAQAQLDWQKESGQFNLEALRLVYGMTNFNEKGEGTLLEDSEGYRLLQEVEKYGYMSTANQDKWNEALNEDVSKASTYIVDALTEEWNKYYDNMEEILVNINGTILSLSKKDIVVDEYGNMSYTQSGGYLYRYLGNYSADWKEHDDIWRTTNTIEAIDKIVDNLTLDVATGQYRVSSSQVSGSNGTHMINEKERGELYSNVLEAVLGSGDENFIKDVQTNYLSSWKNNKGYLLITDMIKGWSAGSKYGDSWRYSNDYNKEYEGKIAEAFRYAGIETLSGDVNLLNHLLFDITHTKYGETPGYTVERLAEAISKYTGSLNYEEADINQIFDSNLTNYLLKNSSNILGDLSTEAIQDLARVLNVQTTENGDIMVTINVSESQSQNWDEEKLAKFVKDEIVDAAKFGSNTMI